MNKKQELQPVSRIQWVERNKLKPNDYNPNRVAPPEMKLLKISIIEDGWTQPIVINADFTIVDGFHRWSVSADEEVKALTNGLVPVVILKETEDAQKRMATIRHNRARGTHGVLEISNIITYLIEEQKCTGEEVMERLQMEKEEVTRLLFKAGIPKSKVFKSGDFSAAWEPEGRKESE